MREKYKLEEVKEFAENPFVNYKSEVQFDDPFIDGLSNIAKSLIKYLVYKQAFEEEKFLFQIDDFNRFMRYINIDYPSDGIVELCAKEVLARTKEARLYWVNHDLFNTGVFQPKYMECTEEDRYN